MPLYNASKEKKVPFSSWMQKLPQSPLLFTGSSHPTLAEEISSELGCSLGKSRISQFPDGETSAEILESVSGRDVFVIQSIAIHPNQYLFELLLLIDALKRSAAKKIVAVIPYLGYCRQDRKDKPGTPITAKLVANLLASAGTSHLVTCDLHADQVEGFFEIPVEHLRCQSLLSQKAASWLGSQGIVLAPDIGSIKLGASMAKQLDLELAVMRKQRLSSTEVKMHLLGSVKGKNVLIVDDLCSTGGTLSAATDLCLQLGANKVMAAITHGLFAPGAIEKLESSPLDQILTTNTVPAPIYPSSKWAQVSIAPLIAQTIRAISS